MKCLNAISGRPIVPSIPSCCTIRVARHRDSDASRRPDGDAMNVDLEVQQTSTGCLIAVMPGVPAEMKPMFTAAVRPFLLNSGMVLRRAVIRTFGFGESDAERLLGDLTARERNPEVGITASEAVISLWVTARSRVGEEAERLCHETCDTCSRTAGRCGIWRGR